MNANVFVDTNVLVYAHVADEVTKHEAALELLNKKLIDENIIISTQILSEFYVSMLKYKREHPEIIRYLNEIIDGANVSDVSLSTVEHCLKLREFYGFSYWDSLMLAAALESKCTVVYTEDLQHGQVIEGKLTIINPFEIQNHT